MTTMTVTVRSSTHSILNSLDKGTDHLKIYSQMDVDAEEKRHRTRSKGVRGKSAFPHVPEAG